MNLTMHTMHFFLMICYGQKSVAAFTRKIIQLKLCLTTQLLNMFKLWSEWRMNSAK